LELDIEIHANFGIGTLAGAGGGRPSAMLYMRGHV
jgi:hypothetical protein